MLQKQPAICVHTSITRESVMILSTQVLFAEKMHRYERRENFLKNSGESCLNMNRRSEVYYDIIELSKSERYFSTCFSKDHT